VVEQAQKEARRRSLAVCATCFWCRARRSIPASRSFHGGVGHLKEDWSPFPKHDLLEHDVVIWLMMDAEQLSVKVREAIVEARIEGESLAYSPLSLYEIAYAAGRKRLRLNSGIPDFIAAIEARLSPYRLRRHRDLCGRTSGTFPRRPD